MSAKKLLGLVAISAAALWSINAGRAEMGITDADIVIGTPNVQSGPSESYGRNTNAGIASLINTVNAEGGIHGRKIKLVSCDDRYEPEASIACFNKLNSDGVFGLCGLVGSTCLAKYLPMCENNKLPAVGFYPGPFFVGSPVKKYCFAARASYRDEMRQTIEHLWNEAGVRKFGVIYQNDPFGADQLEGVKEALKAHNAEVLAAASYVRNKNNVGEAFDEVRKANPEAVICAAVYNPCAQIAKFAAASKFHAIFVANSGTAVDDFIEEAGPAANGFLLTEVVPPPSRTDLPAVANYRKALKEYFPAVKPNFISLRGYMDAVAWIEGLKRTGRDVTRDKFVNALEGIHGLDVGLGKGMELSYSPTDHLGFHKVFFGIVKNGQVESFSDWKKLRH